MGEKYNYYWLLVLLPVIACNSSSSKEMVYEAGMQTIHVTDRSRVYKAGTETTDNLHYRPIDIDIWYPAQQVHADSIISFKYFLDQFLNRRNNYKDTPVISNLNENAQAFAEMNTCSDSTRLLNFKTHSFINAKPAEGSFPLIVYLCSYSSTGFENFTVFEQMAKQGYVVVSINSVGRFPGDMTMKYEDLIQQVEDAVFSITHLRSLSFINFSKIGIMGYSWGGLAGAILATKLPNSVGLVSWDGSEFHHYGQVKDEDTDFDGIINSKDFKNMPLKIPYLRLEQNPPAKDPKKEDSVYNFNENLSASRMTLSVDSAEHFHFCCLPYTVKTSGNCPDNGIYNTVTKLTIAFFNEHLKRKLFFTKIVEGEMNRTVRMKKG